MSNFFCFITTFELANPVFFLDFFLFFLGEIFGGILVVFWWNFGGILETETG